MNIIIILVIFILHINQSYCSFENHANEEVSLQAYLAGKETPDKDGHYVLETYDHSTIPIEINVNRNYDSDSAEHTNLKNEDIHKITERTDPEYGKIIIPNNKVTPYNNLYSNIGVNNENNNREPLIVNFQKIAPSLRNAKNSNELVGKVVTFDTIYRSALETINKHFNLIDPTFKIENENDLDKIIKIGDELLQRYDPVAILTKELLGTSYGLLDGSITEIIIPNTYKTQKDEKLFANAFKQCIGLQDKDENDKDIKSSIEITEIPGQPDMVKATAKFFNSFSNPKKNRISLNMPKNKAIIYQKVLEFINSDTNYKKFYKAVKIKDFTISILKLKTNEPISTSGSKMAKQEKIRYIPFMSDNNKKMFSIPFAIEYDGTTTKEGFINPSGLKINKGKTDNIVQLNYDTFKNINTKQYGKKLIKVKDPKVINKENLYVSDGGISVLGYAGIQIAERKNAKVVVAPKSFIIDNNPNAIRAKMKPTYRLVNDHGVITKQELTESEKNSSPDFDVIYSSYYQNNDVRSRFKDNMNDYYNDVHNDEGYTSSYTDENKYIGNEYIAQNYIDELERADKLSAKKLFVAKYFSGILTLIKFFPISIKEDITGKIDAKVQGISETQGHVYEIVNALNIFKKTQNIINERISKGDKSFKNINIAAVCNVGQISKRAAESCKYSIPNIDVTFENKAATLDAVELFYDKKINNNILLPYENDISNPNSLIKNAETISDVWKMLSTYYINNPDKFSEEESEFFLSYFNEAINSYKNDISTTKYFFKVDEESIKLMISYFENIYNIHKEKYGLILDEDGNEMIYNKEYNRNSQSYYYRHKLLQNLKQLLSLINEHNDNIINEESLGVKIDGEKFSSEINPMTILESDNLMDGIEKISDEIKNLNIDSLDEDKQIDFNEKIKEITNDLGEIKKINDYEYETNGEPSLNSETVHILFNACASKQGMDVDENIIPSENYLSVPELENLNSENEENGIIINHLKNSETSIEGKNYIFKGIENHIIYSDNNNLDDVTYSIISELEEFIRTESLNIEGLQSHEGYHKYVSDFVLFSSYYNHLVAVAIQYDKIFSESLHRTKSVTTVELRNSILLRMLFINNNELADAIQEVVKNNPDKYNQDNQFTDTFSSNLLWGTSVIKKISLTDLNKLFKEPKYFVSLASCMNEIINDANNNAISKLLMKKAYHSKYNYVKYLSPASRDPADIDDLNLNMGNLKLTDNKGNIESIEDYSSMSFYKAMSATSKFNKDINIEALENGNEIISVPDLYKGAISYNDMFKKMDKYVIDLYFYGDITENDKQNIDFSTKQFSIFVRNTKFKFILTLGREHKNTFNNFHNEFSSISNGIFELLKSNNAVTENNNKVDEKLFNLKNVRLVQNVSIKLNSVTKKAKDIRLKKKIRNKNQNQNQNL